MSKHISIPLTFGLLCALFLMGCSASECVTFDPLPTGATYGGPPNTNAPGDQIHTENGIPVTVERFQHGSGAPFNETGVVLPSGFGAVKLMQVNNIALGFDFGGLSFEAQRATFGFADQGGSEFIRVNDDVGMQFVGEIQSIPPATPIAPGVTMTVSGLAPFLGGMQGVVTFDGSVKTLRVGGQEFFLDNVCAHEK